MDTTLMHRSNYISGIFNNKSNSPTFYWLQWSNTNLHSKIKQLIRHWLLPNINYWDSLKHICNHNIASVLESYNSKPRIRRTHQHSTLLCSTSAKLILNLLQSKSRLPTSNHQWRWRRYSQSYCQNNQHYPVNSNI